VIQGTGCFWLSRQGMVRDPMVLKVTKFYYVQIPILPRIRRQAEPKGSFDGVSTSESTCDRDDSWT